MNTPPRHLHVSLGLATLLCTCPSPDFTATAHNADSEDDFFAAQQEVFQETGRTRPASAAAGLRFLQQGRRGDASAIASPRRRQQGDDSEPAPCRCTDEDTGKAGVAFPLVVGLLLIAILLMLSGIFSGLTLGLMGLDTITLQMVQRGGDAEMAKYAAMIMPVRCKGNQLLCTLMLGNAAVNAALAILTAEITGGLVGFLVSTAMIVIFGEILPQAACSRCALQAGSRAVPLVRCLMAVFYILTKPMSVVLDCLLGQEMGTTHNRTALMDMLQLQIQLGAADETEGKIAKQITEGALNFRDKLVRDVMTPLQNAYMLSHETRLDYETIRELFERGFSRVPVFGKDQNDYRGLLYTKDLMLADPEDEMKLGDFISIFGRKVETFFQDDKLVKVLNAFKKGGTHMGLVREVDSSVDVDAHFKVRGVLTLEDVMEEILQEEIVDETDVYMDVEKEVRVTRHTSRDFHLGVFNPFWKKHEERLSCEEVGAIATHLGRVMFCEGSGMELSRRAIEWLVRSSTVENRHRASTLGAEALEIDKLYHYGRATSVCTLVLQGRLTMLAGRDSFPTEAGAFTVLAREALCAGQPFRPDFTAFVGTQKARFLSISKAVYLEARDLDQEPLTLEHSMSQLAAETVGETSSKEVYCTRVKL